jgi:DNA (cytosine-5)-methyltransferase 1
MGHPNPIFAWRSKFSDFVYKADPEQPVRTIKAQGGQYTGPFHWNNRRFTVSELKRLQTFPDNYQIAGGQQVAIQQIGNAVPPQIARILALSILDQVFGVKLPLPMQKLKPTDTLRFRQRKRQRTKLYRQKAKKAIEKLPTNAPMSLPYYRGFSCQLSADFALEEIKNDVTRNHFKIHSYLNADNWQLELSSYESSENMLLEIIVSPTKGNTWNLPTKQISLKTSTLSPKTFSAIWKALENELNHLGLKADLVQLCGYYQYTPSFQCKMSVQANDQRVNSKIRWDIVGKVVNGKGTRKIYSASELGRVWNVSPEWVDSFAVQLKSIGYEVRNSNTNPQIPEGCYLIPYTFPTLNPQSVQLHKTL